MTREEAINILHGMRAANLNLDDAYTKDKYEALSMAIEALEQEPCEDCISRQAAINEVARWKGYLDEDMITRVQIGLKHLPSTQSEIIECKDCKYRGETPIATGRYWCNLHGAFMCYCSDAERRKDERFN